MTTGILAGKAALVTGGAGGLGLAVARVFAREGAELFLVDRDADRLEDGRAVIERAGGVCHALVSDIARPDNCIAAVARAAETFGRLDILCNNAAVLSFDHFETLGADTWDLILAVNLSAPMHLSKAAIPHLLSSGGNIVNVASSGGVIGTAYTVAYSTAKAGLIHMTRCLAMEFMKTPLRINAVAPGSMKTGIGAGLTMPQDIDSELVARFSGLRPSVEPDEVAELIAFVASDRGSAIHGACLLADSGVTAG